MCVCVFFPFILDIKFVGRTSRVTQQEEGLSGFIIHLLSAVRALFFLARRIQPFLSLVDREVEFFCVLTIQSFSTRWAFLFFYFFSEKNPVYRDRTHVPTCQKVTRLPLSYPIIPCTGSSFVFTAYQVRNSILVLLVPCLMVYYIVSVLFLLFFWCPCVAINVSVQYNGGFSPTQCYFHRGTRLNATKRFCICSL